MEYKLKNISQSDVTLNNLIIKQNEYFILYDDILNITSMYIEDFMDSFNTSNGMNKLLNENIFEYYENDILKTINDFYLYFHTFKENKFYLKPTFKNYKSIFFNGVDNFITIPNNILYDTSNITINIWVYPLSNADNLDSIIFKKGNVEIKQSNNYIKCNIGNNIVKSIELVDVNHWYNIIVTIDNDLKLYINNKLQASRVITETITNDDIYIAGHIDNGFFNGLLDMLILFDKVLDNEERNKYYNNGEILPINSFNIYNDCILWCKLGDNDNLVETNGIEDYKYNNNGNAFNYLNNEYISLNVKN